MQAQSDPRSNQGMVKLVDEVDEHRESSSGFQLEDGLDFDLRKNTILSPKEKALRKLG